MTWAPMNPVAPVTQAFTTSLAWVVKAFVHSQRTVTQCRCLAFPLAVLVLALTSLALPATAAAGDYVPGEVIVHYEDGTTAGAEVGVEAETGTDTEQDLPGRSEQLSIEDGESVRTTIAELEDDPSVAYAVPNWRVRARRLRAQRPGLPQAVEPLRPVRHQHARRLGARGPAGSARRPWSHGSPAGQRRGLRALPPLPAGARPAPANLHRAAATSSATTATPTTRSGTAPTSPGTIAQATNNGRGPAGIAYGAKIMPLRVLDWLGLGRLGHHRPRDPLRGPSPGRRDQPQRRLRRPGAGVATSPTCWRRCATPGVRARWSWPPPATRPTSPWPTRRGPRRRSPSGRPPSPDVRPSYSNAGSDIDIVAPGGGEDAENAASAWDRRHCRPGLFGRPILQQTFRREGWVRSFGLPRDYEGTSMASPHVAAVAALVIASGRLGENPPPQAVEEHLEATARDAGRPGFDPDYGHGLRGRRGRAAPQRSLVAPLGRPDDHHAAGSVMGDLVRDASQQEALGSGHALVADHDQVGLLLLGHVQDRVGGVALAGVGLHLHAGLP